MCDVSGNAEVTMGGVEGLELGVAILPEEVSFGGGCVG